MKHHYGYPHLEYEYPISHLFTGSNLGNKYAFAQLDPASNLRGLWSASDNEFYLGAWGTSLIIDGNDLIPEKTTFTSLTQRVLYSLGTIRIHKEIFLPFLPHQDPGDHRAAIMIFRCENLGSESVELTLNHRLFFAALPSLFFTKKPPESQTEKKFEIRFCENHAEITTMGKPQESRVFGAPVPWNASSHDEKSLGAEYTLNLSPHKNLDLQFVFAFSPEGKEEALKTFFSLKDGYNIQDQSVKFHNEILSRAAVATPQPVINRAIGWAKVNMLRVQHQFKIGAGFTNDPPQDIVVLRDLAWYVFGSDYFTPEFSLDLLELAEKYGFHKQGKVTEFIHANEESPELHDYKLNINDDTPLIVYALYHHALSNKSDEVLKRFYPLMERASKWILSQIKDGLVRCYAEGVAVWGICSWRNMIDDYNLTGAVTEINSECYYALVVTSTIAQKLGYEKDAKMYETAARDLKKAINTQLVSEKTGLYLLSIGNDGSRRHDVTGDLIFPVLFQVCDEDMKSKILARLTSEDMWTEYGTRTVSKLEKSYDPDSGYQLVGGLWHNLTAWISYGVREKNPAKLVEGLINIFRLSETKRPFDFVNVVPGEFPERLHGETAQSRGMAMSPWMPPTYLWLVVEGLLGIQPEFEGVAMNPAIPRSWKWIAVKNLPCKGTLISVFLFNGVLYSTYPVSSKYPVKVGTFVETSEGTGGILSIAILINETVFCFVTADEPVESEIEVHLETLVKKQKVKLTKSGAVLLTIPIHGFKG
jgi:glycogen debranching enzyme